MGLLSSVVLLALVFVVALAIAAASSAPHSASYSAYHSASLSDEFSPRIKNPGNLVETASRAADPSGRLTSARSEYSHSAVTPVKTSPGDRLAVPPVIFAASVQ